MRATLNYSSRAKITDQWRNILRKAKTVDLRRDVVTLRDAFERALEKKKKYIGGLLNELEEGEEQYSMAFRAQMENIERMMGVHQVMMMGVHQVMMMVMMMVMMVIMVMMVVTTVMMVMVMTAWW